MEKDLTTSKIDRQNILNNDIALKEIQETANIHGIMFEGKLCYTKDMAASFYGVDLRTIERYISDFSDELKENGYEVIKGKRLKIFFEKICYLDLFWGYY